MVLRLVMTNPGNAGCLRRKTSISRRFSFFQRHTMEKKKYFSRKKGVFGIDSNPSDGPSSAALGAAFNACLFAFSRG